MSQQSSLPSWWDSPLHNLGEPTVVLNQAQAMQQQAGAFWTTMEQLSRVVPPSLRGHTQPAAKPRQLTNSARIVMLGYVEVGNGSAEKGTKQQKRRVARGRFKARF